MGNRPVQINIGSISILVMVVTLLPVSITGLLFYDILYNLILISVFADCRLPSPFAIYFHFLEGMALGLVPRVRPQKGLQLNKIKV